MSQGDLICAHCSGLVIEGNCPVCRVSREQLRPELPVWLIATMILIAVVLAVLAVHPG